MRPNTLPEKLPGKNTHGCAKRVAVAVLLVAIVLIALGAVAFLNLREQEEARVEFAPPTVLATEPASVVVTPAGSYLTVSATAVGGRSPIARAELWVDGKLIETQDVGQPEGAATFPVHFSLLMPSEGPHIVSVRAVNALGIIGKSLPVSIIGGRQPGPGEVFYAVRVEPGETLADIAKSYDTDPATLQKVNPDLGGQEPAAGAVIKVPVPPEKGEEAPAPSPVITTTVPGSAPVPIPDVPMLTAIEPLPLDLDLSWLAVPYTYPAPPDAPQDLQGQVDGCNVMLRWNDFSNNETRYEVWTALGMLSPQLVAELEPSPAKGPAWYKFRAPRTGWVTFWVEAVNPKGKQPSNEIGLFIDSQQCAWKGSGLYSLIVQVFKMTLTSHSEVVYCYVSYEGNPEQRVPESGMIFVTPGVNTASTADFGGTSVGPMMPGPNSKLVPAPQDGALDLTGECWGWFAKTLKSLGTFAGKFTANDWDGARRTIKGASYEIEFAIKPWTPAVEAAALGKYWYEDPTLPAPYDLQFSSSPSAKDPREGVLVWKWDGNRTKMKITGFQVFLDGIPYGYFDFNSANQDKNFFSPCDPFPCSPGGSYKSYALQAIVQNPFYCGHRVRWQVSAVADLAQSPRSAALEIDLPKCQAYAVVKFLTLEIPWTNEGWGGKCDELEVYYDLGIAAWGDGKSYSTQKNFGWGGEKCQGPTIFNCIGDPGYLMQLKRIICQDVPYYYTFQQLGGGFGVPYPDTLVVPMPDKDISIRVGTNFYDHDQGDDDAFGKHRAEHKYPDLQSAQKELGCGGKTFRNPEKDFLIDDDADTAINYTLTVYPNACSDFPLGVPLPVPPWAPNK